MSWANERVPFLRVYRRRRISPLGEIGVTMLLETVDDSFTSTIRLYLSPSQLCLIKRMSNFRVTDRNGDLWWSSVEINIHSLWWIGHPQFCAGLERSTQLFIRLSRRSFVRRPRGGRSAFYYRVSTRSLMIRSPVQDVCTLVRLNFV